MGGEGAVEFRRNEVAAAEEGGYFSRPEHYCGLSIWESGQNDVAHLRYGGERGGGSLGGDIRSGCQAEFDSGPGRPEGGIPRREFPDFEAGGLLNRVD